MPITIGQKLKETRQSLGLSIAEASFQTRIRDKYLEALESNQFKALPSAVQGKGFLRNYAAFLKLDLATIERAWYHPEHLLEDENEEKESTEIVQEPLSEPVPLVSPPNNEPEPQTVIIHAEREDTHSAVETQPANKEHTSESQVIFTEIGKQLREQRELLNLSLEDIERYTNIRYHYLSALEKGKLEDLPSVVQGRGMLNNYANFLNMDIESILLKFAEGLQTRRNEQYAPQKLNARNGNPVTTPRVANPGWRKFITADLVIVSSLIIALFVFILWGAANVSRDVNTSGSATAPSLSDVLLENPTEATPTLGITPTSQASVAVSEVAPLIGDEITPESIQPESGDLPVNIYIIARQRTFLRVTRDGTIVFNGRTVPGNVYEFSGKESIEVLTGNAAGLEVYFNQEQLGTLGGLAEVKTLLFTASKGMVTPTAQITATSAPTLLPTATRQPTNTSTLTPTRPIVTATVTPYIP